MPLSLSDLPKDCQRCGGPRNPWTMSLFNSQVICMRCKAVESKHPKYEHARDAEMDAVKMGDLNYPGIGLPPELEDGGRLWEVKYLCVCKHEWTQVWSSVTACSFCPACRSGPLAPGPFDAKEVAPGD